MSDHLTGNELVKFRVAEAAKAHALGLVLMPVNGKKPAGKAWQKQPPPSSEQVEEWARAGNVGLRTGTVSGVICIDDDTPDRSAAATLGLLTRTATIRTGSGHLNRLYKAPDFAVRNSAGKLAPKVDVRGDGGAVTFVGSVHPGNGKPYTWEPGLSPEDVGFADLTPELLDRLRPKPPRSTAATPKSAAPRAGRVPTRHSRYAHKALQHAVERLAAAAEGTRNDCLNRESFGMGQLVGAGWLHAEDVRPALLAAAQATGLTEAEAAATLESGLAAGIADPVDESILHEPVPARGRDAGDSRPSILIVPGQLPAVVSAAEAALLQAHREPFFERTGVLVRLVRAATAEKKQGIRRPAGALSLMELSAPYLVEAFMHAAAFERLGKRGDIYTVDCPESVARHYLARRGLWTVPHLEQVIEVPIMRADGSLLLNGGYDPATELYLDAGGLVLPGVSQTPTRDEALAALAVLQVPLEKFPFVESSDRATALAAILTTLVRPSLRAAPMFAFRAPKMASGKSLLADVVAMIATGRVAPVMSAGKDDEEIRKRIVAFLLAGFPVGCIDNVEHPFGNEVMCTVLTQAVYRDRVLGRSELATLPTGVTWTITGNNLQFVGDITTRVLPCDLDPKVEAPETRRFDVDLYRYVPEHRGALVAAGLTILRAYQVAGRPDQPLPVFGRFEEWSNAVRSALVWLGEADPCAGMARLRSVDPVRENLRLILGAWHSKFGEQPVTVAKVVAWAERISDAQDAVRGAMEDICRGDGGTLDTRRFGRWLLKHERRVEGGLQVVRMDDKQGVALWAVREVSPRAVGLVGFVGSSNSVPDGISGGEDSDQGAPGCAAGAASRSSDSPSDRGGEIPRNPRNPRRKAPRPRQRRGPDQAGEADQGCGKCPG